MVALVVHLDGTGKFEDWKDREKIHLGEDAPAIRLAGLSQGMTSGKPSVAIGIELPDGRVVIAQTSMRLLLAAAKALEARYKNELGEDWG